MTIHSQVGLWGRRGVPTRITAYFHYGDGRILKDFDGSYAAVDGQVSVGSAAESPQLQRLGAALASLTSQHFTYWKNRGQGPGWRRARRGDEIRP
jgi:hypothetical protein